MFQKGLQYPFGSSESATDSKLKEDPRFPIVEVRRSTLKSKAFCLIEPMD